MKVKELAKSIERMMAAADGACIRITHLTISPKALRMAELDAHRNYSTWVGDALSNDREFLGIPLVVDHDQQFVLEPHYETWRGSVAKFDPDIPMRHGRMTKGWRIPPSVLESNGRVRKPRTASKAH